ncbi:glutamine--fructose-6-phosphate transaminase (isomerizing) [soil metagenome]
MCGIVGYVGDEGCVEVLMEGLGHLEYRGYDSAGLALATGEGSESGEIRCVRRVGPLKNLSSALAEADGSLDGVKTGIGHTRWATHGKPTEENAHPHLGNSKSAGSGEVGEVAVVHNGIVENHAELRRELEGRGREFASETDTEVIAHLLAERVESGEGLRDALASTLARLSGSFAVAAVSVREPETIVAARHQSPLVIGVGEGENFLASAVQALIGRTRRFLLVENGEIATITGSSVEITTPKGEPVERDFFEVDWSAEAVELGGYEDYMQKEIYEQPGALAQTLVGRLDTEGTLDLSEIDGIDLADIDRVVVVACGTAYHAGLLGKSVIERLCRMPVDVEIASEYRYADPIGDERTLVVAISQSGETTDTLAAVEAARGFGGKVLAITNTRGSLITREADAVLLTHAGPEIAVASTKAFTTQLAVMYLLALGLAETRGTLSEGELRELGQELRRSPERVEEALALLDSAEGARLLQRAVGIFDDARCSLFLGRGVSFPVALEGALKLKEISYLPSEGYPAGEMKHGPIALVDEHCPVVAILGEGVHREKTLSNVEETMARGARVITVAAEGDPEAERVAESTLPLPASALGTPELSPLVVTVPVQLLAYHVAKSRGLNVDKPRNLAKSVTVE